MSIKINILEIDRHSVDPAFFIQLEIEYYCNVEAIISVGGFLKSHDGKILGHVLDINSETNRNDQLRFFNKEQKDKVFYGKKSSYFVKFHVPLSRQAVSHIELLRESHPEKSVILNLNLAVKLLELPIEPNNFFAKNTNDSFITIRQWNDSCGYTIGQSEWINKFSKKLGIGNYLLLEMEIPEESNVGEDWFELYERLSVRIKEMETLIGKGNWEGTITIGRKFIEGIKFNEKFKGDKDFKEKLKELFKNDGHSEEGFNDFLNGINSFFNFISKYIHDKSNKTGNLNPIPLITKEDAYFIYALSIGLLNIINRKICKKVN